MDIFHMTTVFHHILDRHTLDYLEFLRILEVMTVALILAFIQTHHHLHIQEEVTYLQQEDL